MLTQEIQIENQEQNVGLDNNVERIDVTLAIHKMVTSQMLLNQDNNLEIKNFSNKEEDKDKAEIQYIILY